jgi:Holliday junction resolvasome RuvABC endonuclease subunit
VADKKKPTKPRSNKNNFDKEVPQQLHYKSHPSYKTYVERADDKCDYNYYNSKIPEISMSRSAGLDFSINAPAVATIKNGKPITLTIKCDKDGVRINKFTKNGKRDILFESQLDRLKYIQEMLDVFFMQNKIDTLYVEGYSYGSKGRSFDLAEATGAILFSLSVKHRFTIYKVPPSVVKYKLTANALISKPFVWRSINKIIPHKYESYDASDAMAVLFVGHELNTVDRGRKSEGKNGSIIKWG